jgi:hypothetical protein
MTLTKLYVLKEGCMMMFCFHKAKILSFFLFYPTKKAVFNQPKAILTQVLFYDKTEAFEGYLFSS